MGAIKLSWSINYLATSRCELIGLQAKYRCLFLILNNNPSISISLHYKLLKTFRMIWIVWRSISGRRGTSSPLNITSRSSMPRCKRKWEQNQSVPKYSTPQKLSSCIIKVIYKTVKPIQPWDNAAHKSHPPWEVWVDLAPSGQREPARKIKLEEHHGYGCLKRMLEEDEENT